MQPTKQHLDQLLELALALGADDAAIVPAEEILVDPKLAALCKETRCPNYGRAPTCPPYVSGPAWLLTYLQGISFALFLKIEQNREQMYSDRRLEIGKLLHFIVIEVEKAAKGLGLDKAFGFAGGSCKELFCAEQYVCEVLEGSGMCRHPDAARPSVSGFGINTRHLLQVAGWARDNNSPGPSITARYGLILLG